MIEVNVTPEQINEAVAGAIIKSSIGKALAEVIDAQVKKLSQSYDNPIAPVVQDEIGKAIRVLIADNFLPQIKAKIAEKLTDEVIADMFEKMWRAFMGRCS